jgi:thymidylate synthase
MIDVFDGDDGAMMGTLDKVLRTGSSSSPRGKMTMDITMLSFVIRNPRMRICASRDNMRMGYPAALLAWNLGQRNDVAGLLPWNPNAAHFSDDDETVQGENYGRRMWPSLQGALHVLKKDKFSRRAWVSVWKPGREYGEAVHDVHAEAEVREQDELLGQMPVMKSSNVPCCIGFGLRIVENKLVMQTVMRSQSVWGVFPYDVFLFTTLQELIANELDVKLGWYEHVTLSAHCYDYEVKWIRAALEKQPTKVEMKPIDKALTQAAVDWPELLRACNGESDPSMADVPHKDPIEQLIYDNRPEVSRVS